MQPFRLRDLVYYFFKLGATGFGGPVALIGYMQKDLVEKRRWFTQDEYLEGVALAQVIPGPLAMQLAIYFGYLKGKILGASAIAIAFILAPFLMVWGLAYLYLQYHGLPFIHSALYGMNAGVIGVIAISAINLLKISLNDNNKKALWFIALIALFSTAFFEKIHIFFFILCGFLSIIFYAMPRGKLLMVVPLELMLFFMKAAVVVYGSGMAIIPFIYHDVVHHYQWLSEQQFLDAVAVGMITPGPVMITVGFIGYLVDHFRGALLSVIAIFLPVYLFVILFVPHFKNWIKNIQVKAFVEGVTAAVAGSIAGSVWILGRKAIIDPWTFILAATVLILQLKTKVPLPLLLIASGLTGIAIGILK